MKFKHIGYFRNPFSGHDALITEQRMHCKMSMKIIKFDQEIQMIFQANYIFERGKKNSVYGTNNIWT